MGMPIVVNLPPSKKARKKLTIKKGKRKNILKEMNKLKKKNKFYYYFIKLRWLFFIGGILLAKSWGFVLLILGIIGLVKYSGIKNRKP